MADIAPLRDVSIAPRLLLLMAEERHDGAALVLVGAAKAMRGVGAEAYGEARWRERDGRQSRKGSGR